MPNNVLTDPMIRVHAVNGAKTRVSLCELYSALRNDRVRSFPGLRPHQRHAWHAFLAQLAAIAMQRAGETTAPGEPDGWLKLLRGLTPGFPCDEPWLLVENDPSRPAFMQCPAPEGLDAYKNEESTPDGIDVIVTSKNHNVKKKAAARSEPDSWIFALVSVQTMGGYLGAGNYGIARMNGGYGSRPCLGLAPEVDAGDGRRARGLPGAHLFHDVGQLVGLRDWFRNEHEYFKQNSGLALLWLEPWDGKAQLRLDDLDPLFIEVCRRVRLVFKGAKIAARRGTSKKARIAADESHGRVGDYWTPVDVKDGKALSVPRKGFRYDQLEKLLFDRKTYDLPPSMQVKTRAQERWRVVARGAVNGKGKTEGYHERDDVVFGGNVVRALGRPDDRDQLAVVSKSLLKEVAAVASALKFGIATAASGGKNPDDLAKGNRLRAGPYVQRFEQATDERFFAALERRFTAVEAKDEAARKAARREFAREEIKTAEGLLEKAIKTVPQPAFRRHRARAKAMAAFMGSLRGQKSMFADQPEIFTEGDQHE